MKIPQPGAETEMVERAVMLAVRAAMLEGSRGGLSDFSTALGLMQVSAAFLSQVGKAETAGVLRAYAELIESGDSPERLPQFMAAASRLAAVYEAQRDFPPVKGRA